MTDERDLTCTRCGSVVHVIAGEWIDPDLYECDRCRRGEGPLQATLADSEEFHGERYDPAMAKMLH